MPTITVPDDTYQRLAARAASLGTSVEALAVPALEGVAQPSVPPDEEPYALWKAKFENLLTLIRNRGERYSYPPGFEVDVSREAMYEGCGE